MPVPPRSGTIPDVDDRPGTDRAPTVDRLSVAEAAARLGLSTDAVRSRLNRGTLGGHKEAGGWVVLLRRPSATVDQPSPTGQRPGSDRADPDATGALIERQRDEIAFLRDQLREREQTHAEEIRRRDHIVAGLIERLPALGSGEGAPLTPQDAPGAAEPSEPTDTPLAPWWRRWLARLGGGPSAR